MRYDCRYGLPHDLQLLGDTPSAKWEICRLCNKRFRWNKGYKGRVQNTEYLKAHARNFAQSFGATRRLYKKLYEPEKCVITLTTT